MIKSKTCERGLHQDWISFTWLSSGNKIFDVRRRPLTSTVRIATAIANSTLVYI